MVLNMMNEPKIHCNTGEEDRLAIQMLSEKDIPFINLGQDLEMPTPYLIYGHWTFSGIRGIKEFITRWESDTLPPLE